MAKRTPPTSKRGKGKTRRGKKTDNTEKGGSLVFRFIDVKGMRNLLGLYEFVRWLALPKDERRPKTHGEFAKQIGVGIDALTDWKKLPHFYDEVKDVRDVIFRKYSSDVYGALVKAAKKGNIKAVEFFAKLFDGYRDKLDVKDETPPREIPPEQKQLIADALKNVGLATIIQHNEQARKEAGYGVKRTVDSRSDDSEEGE